MAPSGKAHWQLASPPEGAAGVAAGQTGRPVHTHGRLRARLRLPRASDHTSRAHARQGWTGSRAPRRPSVRRRGALRTDARRFPAIMGPRV